MKKILSILLACTFALSFATVAFAATDAAAQADFGSIIFDTQGGSLIATMSGTSGTACVQPSNPTKSGYTFTGWQPAFPGLYPAAGTSVTCVAQWTKNATTIQVTIKFDSNGGSAVADLTGAPNDYLVPPAPPTRAGYSFIGWNLVNPATVTSPTTAATNATTNVSPAIAYGLPARFPNVAESTTYWYKAVWQMVDPTIATVKVAGSTEPVEAWATFLADEFQTFVDSKEVQDLIADAKTAVANGGTDGIASAVDSWVKDVADQLDIPITDVKSWLADSEIFNAFADMYITDEETTTVAPTEVTEPVTEATTQGTIPQTGSATAGIAIFATLSLAAAAAFVCTKKR